MVQRKHRTNPVGLGQSIPDSIVQSIAQAIATAEGFFSSPSALPRRANNPGDLMLGDIGFGTINGKTIYATVEDGWNALYHQVRLMLTGVSAYYTPDMTITQMAEKYTGGDNPLSWAMNVARSLGVSIETKLSDLLGIGGSSGSPPATPGGGPSSDTIAILIFGVILFYLMVS